MKKLILAFTLLTITSSISQVTFQDVAGQMGINYSYGVFAYGGGVSFFDFDNDGNDDLSFASYNSENVYLFKNNITSFLNITPQLNILDTMHSKTILWSDYDNDGDQDLFVANFNSRNSLYKNDGNFNFTDVTVESGLNTETQNSTSACIGDYDNDGWLDIYVLSFATNIPNTLYHNNGNGTFTDVTAFTGVGDTSKLALACSFFDYNLDGWCDLYIANDRKDGNTLFKNNGDGTFTDVSVESNTDLRFDCMGIAIGDYDNDLDLDIYVSNGPDGNGLLKNNGDGTFTEIATQLGIQVKKICWGVNFIDFDNDSDLDLFVSVMADSGGTDSGASNILFENLGDGTFAQMNNTGFENENAFSFGNAIGDFNNDGYYDIAVMNSTPYLFSLWQNDGTSNNWLKIKLAGTSSNTNGIGNIIEIIAADKHFIRYTQCGSSYLSQNSRTETIGVGNLNLIDTLRIKWTSGLVDEYINISVNQNLTCTEGETIVPVELTSFTAQANNNEVVLNWSTATEINNSGFEIEKRQVFSPQSSIGNMNWNVVGFVPGFGTTTEPKSYSFTDDDISEANYQYRLKQIDFDGSYEYSNIVEVSIINADNFELEQNYPNPFNPATTISFNLENDSQVSLIIFDVLGQQVSHLINRELEAGRHSINFNASSLISGVYFYKLRVKNQSGTFFEAVKKMIFNK